MPIECFPITGLYDQTSIDSTNGKPLKYLTINSETIDNSNIKGWGIDADPKNDPTYPIQKRKEGPLKYERKGQKQQSIIQEVLYSNERPNISAVYGLGPEPSGLSGKLRRFTFEHGENEYSHWIPLILADRVNEIEGIIDDIKHGKFPNIIVEKGWPAQWKHDKMGLITKLAVFAAITTGTIWLLVRKKKNEGVIPFFYFQKEKI